MSSYQLAFNDIADENEMHDFAKSMILAPIKMFSRENFMTINEVGRAVSGIKLMLETWVKTDREDLEGTASFEMALLNQWLDGSAIGEIGGTNLASDYVAELYDKLAKRTAKTYEELDVIQDIISSWGATNPSRENKDALDAVDDDREVHDYCRRAATLVFELMDLRKTIYVYEMARQYYTKVCSTIECEKAPYGLVSLTKVDSYRLGCFCGCKTQLDIMEGVHHRNALIRNIDVSIMSLKHMLHSIGYVHLGDTNGILTPEYL